VNELLSEVKRHTIAHGLELAEGVDAAVRLLLEWLAYLRTSESTGTADVLLAGVRAAVIEVGACLALGLVRPALLAMRAQIDMVLAWLFFKDHPVEWRRVERSGDGFQSRSDVIQYLSQHVPGFKYRYKILGHAIDDKKKNLYSLLSAHVHGQSGPFIPKIESIDNLVSPIEQCKEGVELQKQVAAYLADLLMSCFAHNWADMPNSLVDSTRARISPKEGREFFSATPSLP
jgi:hypothetical protein